MQYRIDLTDFMEEVFEKLEDINQSGHGHELVVDAIDETHAAEHTCHMLVLFFQEHFEAVKVWER